MDDHFFSRIYSELMEEQLKLFNEIRHSTEDLEKRKIKQKQITVITAILNSVSKLKDLGIKLKTDE
jgi:hypothetical protein